MIDLIKWICLIVILGFIGFKLDTICKYMATFLDVLTKTEVIELIDDIEKSGKEEDKEEDQDVERRSEEETRGDKKSKRQQEIDKLIDDTNYLIDLVIKEHDCDRISEKEMKRSIERFKKALKMNLKEMNVDIEDVDDRIHKFRAPKPKNVDEVIRESMSNGKRFKNYNSGWKRLY